jgi:prepilin-type N-terminal cleavage/methylation domain-containing protein
MCAHACKRCGLSLVEVLIVVAIIAILVQLALPAIEMSRESARRTQCANNIRQLGLAVQQHESAFRRYPSSGWHFTWIGEPERGTDAAQPGSWAFNLLAYMEQQELRDMGSGLDGEARTNALIQRTETALPLFICPSRRKTRAYRHTWNQWPYTKGGPLTRPLRHGAKADYATNVGDSSEVEFDSKWKGPQSLEEGDGDIKLPTNAPKFTGVIFGRSQIEINQITDGLSKTYLIGEKHVYSKDRNTGEDMGDNESLYTGFNNDTCRSGAESPEPDSQYVFTRNMFGSSHPSVWLVVFCDGSVREMSFDIDSVLHGKLANRHDNLIANP